VSGETVGPVSLINAGVVHVDQETQRPSSIESRARAAGRHRIAVVGAGAAGTLSASRLLDLAHREAIPLEVILVDPSPTTGRGAAFSTEDEQHLLNVPTQAISADPAEPADFLRWLAENGAAAEPYSFQPRSRYARYLADRLERSARTAAPASVLHRSHNRVADLTPGNSRALTLDFESAGSLDVDAAVLALGQYPPDNAWAPEGVRNSPHFVANPWQPGVLGSVSAKGDVLLVGTGLTMVDVALSLDRPGRKLHAVSRTGLLPHTHTARPGTPVAPPPELATWQDLATLRRGLLRHISKYRRETGDWRLAFDSLRPLTSRLWQCLSLADQERFLASDRRMWETHRHRMAPGSAARLNEIRAAGRLTVRAATVVSAAPAADGKALTAALSDGRALRVSAVVDCTTPTADFRRAEAALPQSLFASGTARPGPHGLGFDTAPDGRLLSAQGATDLPLWTLGCARRGSLWESTAIGEIRTQAVEVASSVLDVCRTTALRPDAGEGARPELSAREA
jgi:uncharacterized NAD(P)/FAD-binding protein YdhS